MKTTPTGSIQKPDTRHAPGFRPHLALVSGLLALMAAGCDDGQSHSHTDVVETYSAVDHANGDYALGAPRTYAIAVQALTPYNAAIAGAEVRLIVSTAPEQVAYAYTGADGVARFVLDAYPGVPVTADVSAYGWGSDFVTAYTDGYSDALVMQLVLVP